MPDFGFELLRYSTNGSMLSLSLRYPQSVDTLVFGNIDTCDEIQYWSFKITTCKCCLHCFSKELPAPNKHFRPPTTYSSISIFNLHLYCKQILDHQTRKHPPSLLTEISVYFKYKGNEVPSFKTVCKYVLPI